MTTTLTHAEPGTAQVSRDDALTHKGGLITLDVISKYVENREQTLNACIARAVELKNGAEMVRLRERLDVIQTVILKIEDYRDGLAVGLRRFEGESK